MKSPAMSLPFVCKYRLMYSFSASVALSFHHPTAVSLSCVPAASQAQVLECSSGLQQLLPPLLTVLKQEVYSLFAAQ